MRQIRFNLTGISFRRESFDAAQVRVGDILSLKPEPTNRFDPQAIAVLKRGVHIAYVPAKLCAQVHSFRALGPTLTVVTYSLSGYCRVKVTELSRAISLAHKRIATKARGTKKWRAEQLELQRRWFAQPNFNDGQH